MPRVSRVRPRLLRIEPFTFTYSVLEMVEDWQRRVERADTSLSKFVIERVLDSIRREDGGEGYPNRAELTGRLRMLMRRLSAYSRKIGF